MESSETSDEVQWYGASVMTPLDLCALQVPQCLEVANHAYMIIYAGRKNDKSFTDRIGKRSSALCLATLLSDVIPSYSMLFPLLPDASRIRDMKFFGFKFSVSGLYSPQLCRLLDQGQVSQENEHAGRREAF